MDSLIILFRLALTFFLALFFGMDRQKTHKPIGFGTFTFVASGSCGLAILAHVLSPENPLPLLSAIVTGIGFLGAGALMKTSDKVYGFTGAASIWIFAVFGLSIGSGQYLIGLSLYVLILSIFYFDIYLEKKGIGSYQRKIMITTNKIINEKELTTHFMVNTKKFKLITVNVNKSDNKMEFLYMIEGTKEDINKIPRKLYEKDWFASCKVE